MDSANNWCFAFGPVPCPAGSTCHGLRDTLSRGFHVQHALIFLLFHHASCLLLFPLPLWLQVIFNLLITPKSMPLVHLNPKPSIQTTPGHLSLLGWEAVGFTAHPPTQLLKPEAGVSSLTPPSLSYSTAIQQQVWWILPSKSLPNPSSLPSSLPPPR